ncbi:MAG: response regulator [Caldithrix sp.]|nr:response regulator [Caldithrix sp.]
MKFLNVCVISLFLFLEVSALTANPNLMFDRITGNETLASSVIFDIDQDGYGFIWIATDQGLFKYDGYHFTHYTADPNNINTLSHNKVHQITPDPQDENILWLATDLGFDRLSIREEAFNHYFVNNKIQQVKQIVFDYADNMWIRTAAGAVFQFDTENPTFHKQWPAKPTPHINSSLKANYLFATKSGDIWLSIFRLGLAKYQHDSQTFDTIPFKYARNENKDNIVEIIEGSRSNLWVCTDLGHLYSFNILEGQYELVPIRRRKHDVVNNRIISMHRNENGNLWLGRIATGLDIYNPQTGQLSNYRYDPHDPRSISANDIQTIFKDRNGNIWLGTTNQGILKTTLPIYEFQTYRQNKEAKHHLSSEKIYDIYEDSKENIWLATAKGINQLNRQSGLIKHYLYNADTREGHYVTALVSDGQKRLWAGTIHNGLLSYNPFLDQFSPDTYLEKTFDLDYNLKVFTLLLSNQGYLWIGTINQGLFRYNPQEKSGRRWVHIKGDTTSLSNNTVLSIFEDSQKNIWIGTTEGVSRFLPLENAFLHYKMTLGDSSGTNTPSVRSINETKGGFIWFGTSSRGLVRLNTNDGTIQTYTKMNGLPSNKITAITKDRFDNLWISTKEGICYFNQRNEAFSAFNQNNGLILTIFNSNSAYRNPESGEIFFGGKHGLVSFFPQRIKTINYETPLLITSLRLLREYDLIKTSKKFHKTFNQPDEIKLSYEHDLFIINYAALNFKDPDVIKYAYKLEGLHDKWNHVGSTNFATFVNPPPGEYTFRVKTLRNPYNQQTSSASLSLIIVPPFWQELWFRLSSVVLFVLLVFGIVQWRLKIVKKRNRELQQVNERLNNEINFRKQVEELLRKGEQKYRTLVESMNESVFALNQDGNFIFANHITAERMQIKQHNLIGKNIYRVLDKPYAETIMKEVWDVLKTSTSKMIEMKYPLNEIECFFQIYIHPLKGEVENEPQVLCIGIDITEQVTLEEQLRQSQKMEAVGKLAGGLAHDFNNLIAIIQGYSDLIRDDFNNHGLLKESVDEIDKASVRAENLIRQLLTFSRRQVIQPQVLNLNFIITEMQKMLTRLIKEDIELWTRFDQDLKPVFVDRGQIEQILVNMVINARDAMPEGGKITLFTQNVVISETKASQIEGVTPGEYILLKVEDDGIGMHKETVDKIFEPFFTTKEAGEGTGLGLSTVFGIIKQNYGFIEVESKPGIGTRFLLYFPSVDEKIQLERPEVLKEITDNKHEKILVVEDESGLRNMILKRLKMYGYEVYTACDGQEALNIIETNQNIEVVLTDVVMPRMKGYELVNQIRAKGNHDIKVIYMTGYHGESSFFSNITDKQTSYIQKPFKPEELNRQIRNLLHNN